MDFQTRAGLSTITEQPTEIEFLKTYTDLKIMKRITREIDNITTKLPVKDLIESFGTEVKSAIVRQKTMSVFLMLGLRDKVVVPAWLYLNDDYVYISVAYDDPAIVEEAFEKLVVNFPKREPRSAKQVPIGFWTFGKNGPHKNTRNIEVQPYDEIKDNYASKNHEAALKLLDFKPTRGGQVFLLSGCAGTGKSRLIMSLFQSWKEWASFSFVVDPMTMFGGSAEYLNTVLFDEQEDEFDEMFEAAADATKRKWRVILMEDVGQLLSQDAARETGQGLSQLLNATDGLIGQGLKILFIITTNEKIDKLHPAVSRPGRCAMRHEFTAFTTEEANAWLKAHDLPETADGERTLADLYAIKDGSDVKRTESDGRNRIGFGVN